MRRLVSPASAPCNRAKPITRSELVQPVLVKRDQPVMIVSHTAGITASMPGVALKNGRKGDVIKIRNSSSQRIISGMVDDIGVVTTLTAEQ
ncbi:flagellar P-ring addition protein [Citrobacter braakii]|nr:flagellar P-ring addition protein [Citrobacter braakii]